VVERAAEEVGLAANILSAVRGDATIAALLKNMQ